MRKYESGVVDIYPSFKLASHTKGVSPVSPNIEDLLRKSSFVFRGTIGKLREFVLKEKSVALKRNSSFT
jgi:hypothetical protein